MTSPAHHAHTQRRLDEMTPPDDGKTVMVSTFYCGLYVLDGIATVAPSVRKVGTRCAVPIGRATVQK